MGRKVPTGGLGPNPAARVRRKVIAIVGPVLMLQTPPFGAVLQVAAATGSGGVAQRRVARGMYLIARAVAAAADTSAGAAWRHVKAAIIHGLLTVSALAISSAKDTVARTL